MFKQSLSFRLLAFSACLSLFFSCKDKCDGNKSIEGVAPDTNPPGYEVIIQTNGFTEAAQVRFGSQEAEVRAGAENGELIARVPGGLAGNVQITVEEGDCLVRFDDFNVSGSLPTDLQASLKDIVLPLPPATYPSNFTNAWFNAADLTFTSGIQFDDDGTGTVAYPATREFDFDGQFFDDNPVNGTVNISTNEIHISIDRRAKGGTLEEFDGQFVVPPANAQHAMLLVSRQSGRQLLLVYI